MDKWVRFGLPDCGANLVIPNQNRCCLNRENAATLFKTSMKSDGVAIKLLQYNYRSQRVISYTESKPMSSKQRECS